MVKSAPRILVFGAHPDDAEIFAGGLLVRHCRAGSQVRIISVTDGRSGHHILKPEALVQIRRAEAQAAGERIGAEYFTWDFADGRLEPTIEVREAIIREVRNYQPDLILTHRPYDYHPDHRAVGIAVQDASYLFTVPHICADVPALRQDPVVGYMVDLFTRPNRLRADVILDVRQEFDLMVQMTACHASQVFEWLPYHDNLLDELPQTAEGQLDWLSGWLREMHRQRLEHFQTDLVARGLTLDEDRLLEVYELSEYAGKAGPDELQLLFPQLVA